MKLSTILVLCSFFSCSSGFVASTFSSTRVRGVSPLFGYELKPEVEGGDELISINPTFSRVKSLGEVKGETSRGAQVHKIWMSTVGEGKLIKEYQSTLLKDAAKKANFPGFRKGQVPPYAMPQITGFAIQEALVKSVEATLANFGLQSLPGSDGQVTVLEEVQEMSKGYKSGDNLKFTATLKCAFVNAKIAPPVASPVVDAIVDVEVE